MATVATAAKVAAVVAISTFVAESQYEMSNSTNHAVSAHTHGMHMYLHTSFGHVHVTVQTCASDADAMRLC